MRQDPHHNGGESWKCVLGEFETTPLDVSDMPFLRVFPTSYPPSSIPSSMWYPGHARHHGGYISERETVQKGTALLKLGF